MKQDITTTRKCLWADMFGDDLIDDIADTDCSSEVTYEHGVTRGEIPEESPNGGSHMGA